MKWIDKLITAIVIFVLLLTAYTLVARAEEPVATTVIEETKQSTTLDLSTLIAKLPSLNQAILYSWDTNQVKYAMSFTMMSLFDDRIKIDAMYVPSVEIGALASVKLLNVGKIIKFPILEYIELEPFVYAGVKRLGSGDDLGEIDYGLGCKLINIKF